MNKKLWLPIVLIIVIFLGIKIIAGIYIDYQWFLSYNKTNTFWTLFFTKFNVHLIFSLFFAFLFIFNFGLIRILGGQGRIITHHILENMHVSLPIKPRTLIILILGVIILLASIFMGGIASSYWQEYLIFKNQVAFSGFPKDPIFVKDIGFYIFSLPFYKFIYSWLFLSLATIIVFSIVFHIFNSGIIMDRGRPEFSLFARAHLSTLFALIVILYGLSYRLSAYDLLFSTRGKFYGAGYTAVNSQLLAYNICLLISFIAAIILIVNIFKKSFKLAIYVLLTIIPAYIILGSIYPSLQQKFIVIPDELNKEGQYIRNNIKFTRIAYNINKIKNKKFANNNQLSRKDLEANLPVLNNIRLWDWQPLQQTYKQLQKLKPYYNFIDVDVDRYIIEKNKTAVNLAARELDINKLSSNSQTWLNRHLIYTHGYGLVMNKVNKISPQGLPQLIIKDIPPQSSIDINIERPQIYYGEHQNPYIITDTNLSSGEFDYPSGDTNTYSIYQGSGGIKLDSIFKKLMFAVAMGDINILISNNITGKSKILFRRNIIKMIKEITPFLMLDNDPYLVTANGKLYWMIDGFTTSQNFPYSTPIYLKKGDQRTNFSGSKINYIRNSVKIIIDAYNGKINYYIADSTDPIIKTFNNIFPDVFSKMQDMPENLKAHIRYPETLFNIQSSILQRYHMTDINVFYNNEDLWSIPDQIYVERKKKMEAYYLVTRLPGEKDIEFVLMLPFTPRNIPNMIAFIVAKCDPENYGQLSLYSLPKDKLSYGPMQLEGRINQDTKIKSQLTLWGKGQVYRGNMLAIPVKESLLFVEPLYLKSDSNEMPELKRVILSFGDKIVMEQNLELALEKMFQNNISISQSADKDNLPQNGIKTDQNLKTNIRKAYNIFLKAESLQRSGDWAGYGREVKKLKDLLKDMQ